MAARVNMVPLDDGKWETVKKPRKPTDDAEDKKKKKKKKGAKDTAEEPKKSGEPVKGVETNSAFAALEVMLKKEQAREAEANRAAGITADTDDSEDEGVPAAPAARATSAAPATSAEPAKPKKPKAPKVKKPKVTVKEVAEAIDLPAVNSFLDELVETYGEDGSTMLKRCADFLDKTFKSVELPFNRLLEEKSVGEAALAPLGDVPSEIVKSLVRWLKARPLEAAVEVAPLLLSSVLESAGSVVPKPGKPPSAKANVGQLAMLAVVLRAHPGALLPHLPQYAASKDLRKPEKLRMLLWAYTQAGRHGARGAAVVVWVRHLAGLAAGCKPGSEPHEKCLQFLEAFLPANKAERAAAAKFAASCRLLAPCDAIDLLHQTFGQAGTVPRLTKHYAELREYLLAAVPEGQETVLLKASLEALPQRSGAEEAGHVAGIAVWCLARDLPSHLPTLAAAHARCSGAGFQGVFSALAAAAGAKGELGVALAQHRRAALAAVRRMRAAHHGAAPSPAIKAADQAARLLEGKLRGAGWCGCSSLLLVAVAGGAAAVALGAVDEGALQPALQALEPARLALQPALQALEPARLALEPALAAAAEAGGALQAALPPDLASTAAAALTAGTQKAADMLLEGAQAAKLLVEELVRSAAP